jgi:hypothetical protein
MEEDVKFEALLPLMPFHHQAPQRESPSPMWNQMLLPWNMSWLN